MSRKSGSIACTIIAFIIMVIFIGTYMMAEVQAARRRSDPSRVQRVVASPDPSLADFEVLSTNLYGAMLVDRNTGVIYYWNTTTRGGITPVYNADGTLKLYEREFQEVPEK
ncbi:MAG: hypothetical protein NC489_41660 [Ruminococcus flavefaciens]|nr:hypothetical protein [Ruminococcus flavefaciens]